MLPEVWRLHSVPAMLQLSIVGLVGRAHNPSKLVYLFRFWPFLQTSKVCKAGALQRRLALCRQQLPYLCDGSPWQCAVGSAEKHFDTSALARRLEPVSGRFGQSYLQDLNCLARSRVADLKAVKSARKQAGSLVAEHGSRRREFQKSRRSRSTAPLDFLTTAHKVKAAPTVARPLRRRHVPWLACDAQPLPRFIPASKQWPIVVLSRLPEYALLASGRHPVEDRAHPRPCYGATSKGAKAKQK